MNNIFADGNGIVMCKIFIDVGEHRRLKKCCIYVKKKFKNKTEIAERYRRTCFKIENFKL